MRNALITAALVFLGLLPGCGPRVDITKTAEGFRPDSVPDKVEILQTVPRNEYEEVATISTSAWPIDDTAKMHNALRAKAAPLGADAVVITTSGQTYHGYGIYTQWANGVAIRYKKGTTTSSAH